MLQQEGSIELYAGEAGIGPAYGSATKVPCRVEPMRKLVIDTKGNEVAVAARAFLEPDVTIKPESRFSVDGVAYRVLDVKRQIGANGQAHHLEVMLVSGS